VPDLNDRVRRLRVGVLGTGRIVGPAMMEPAAARPDVEIRAIASRDEDRARAAARQHDIAAACAGYGALIERDDIDLVYIALPPALHGEWTVRSLAAGKAVLCEKPLAMNPAEVQAMYRAAHEAGRPLVEAMHYRFHPIIRTIGALIADGRIGTVRAARGRLGIALPDRPGEHRLSASLGGGALMDLGCYPLNALHLLLGGGHHELSARATSAGGVDLACAAQFRLDAGTRASILCALRAPTMTSSLVFRGTKGSIGLQGFIMPHRNGEAWLECDGRVDRLEIDPVSTYAAQLDHMLKLIRAGDIDVEGEAASRRTAAAISAISAVLR
jgi:predicted dehydrogenase